MRVRDSHVRAVVVVTLSALALGFAVRNAGSVRRLAADAGQLDHWMTMIGLACSALAIVNRGLLNQTAHRAVGIDAGFAAMTQTSAVGFAAQKIVKPAGAASLAVFVTHGRHRGHAAGTVTAACLLTASASFAALGILLGVAVTVLAATRGLTGWWLAAAAGFGIYGAMIAAVAAVLLRRRSTAVSAWQFVSRWWNRVRGRHDVDSSAGGVPDALFHGFAEACHRRRSIARLVLHAVASKLLGALMLVAAVTATGLPIGATDALVIYSTALAVSMVAIVPGGVGVVEGSTMALLVSSGATAGSAALAVALFRLFDLWLPVLIGGAMARCELRASAPQPVRTQLPVGSHEVSFGALTQLS